ncbi:MULTISPECIES: indolepyruvate oxidoreductase subunit beta [unclassified Lentimicrobium]|uniref:indolepyruvate oxidoreductase subunit beta n=1 Tax=unclassified Lentimicrobium TaxID=2677434 RepID=UPI00155168E0|nr:MULTISPECIES: indolepyruvate oxidoreductase subunit beta [unclassified Lentimicrobium]NPD48036.1 indolepyruvate oxidoreductase subunit beta [Lentimicrobium sp. S6]NPD83932.1 indolepyruvate oxidoreductase subunit beta [Lentimicrobium sp. L6]
MKTDIILAGVGGQGILSIAATIGMSALSNNLHLKQAEVHGMSQRGGAVQSHFRLSSKPIASDLIPKGGCDIILSVEPMESLRYIDFLKKDGWIITNSTPFVNIPNYPDVDEVIAKIKERKNVIILDADKIAKEIGSPRSSNIVALGAATPFIDIPFESFEEAIKLIFKKKGDKIINANIEALRAGRAVADAR